MERLRILVLFGGCSSEHEVSLQSAHGVLTHMDPERYCPIPVGITREGAWYVYTGLLDAIPDGRWQREAGCVPCTLRLDRGSRALVLLDGSGREAAFDLAFPVLHGRNGEDGTVQGALELAGVPLAGCGTLSSALCMDKDRAHKLAAMAGVRVPRSRLFPEGSAFEEILGVKSILLGFGLAQDAIHSPNESYGLDQFFRGIETISCFYRYFSEM